MKRVQLSTMLLLLAALAFLAHTTTFQGRQLSGTCCSQCFESKVMSLIFNPNRTAAMVFGYLQRNVPSVFYSSILKFSPAPYTEEIVDVMEELKLRDELGMISCDGPLRKDISKYYRDMNNVTINSLFVSVQAIVQTRTDSTDQDAYTWMHVWRQTRQKFNDQMKAAQNSPVTQVQGHRYDEAEALAKIQAMFAIGTEIALMTREEQQMVYSCLADLQQEARDNENNHQIPYQLRSVPQWLMFPEDVGDQSVEEIGTLGKLKMKFDLKRKLRLRKYNKTRGNPYKKRSAYPKYRWCPKPLTIRQMYKIGVLPLDHRVQITRKPQGKMTADASDTFPDLTDHYPIHKIDIQRSAPQNIKINHYYFLRQLAEGNYDAKIYTSPDDQGTFGAGNMFMMDEERTRVYAKIVAKPIGSFLHCHKPEVLDLLKNSCPETCSNC